jgi:hypothetical protein
MKIMHRISFNTHRHPALLSRLQEIGLKYTDIKFLGKGGNFISFEIFESDPRWINVHKRLKRESVVNRVETFFTDEEIIKSEWLRLVPTFEQGYPQPKNTWVDELPTYENICRQCGTYDQKSSFILKDEPYLHNKQFMVLIWTYAIFCDNSVFDEFEAHSFYGYRAWDAIVQKTGLSSQKIHQLFIPQIAEPGLVDVGLRYQTCSTCGKRKYYPHVRGVMSINRGAIDPKLDFSLTNEWFGSGGFAYREILVSNRVASLIIEKKWQGARLKVVTLT